MLSAKTIATVKATVPVLQQHGETVTTRFYQILFQRYPEVKAYFNPAHQVQGTQPRALANSVLAYASHIDQLDALSDALPTIIQKHVALDIRPEHYPLVGECLLAAIREVLGDAATEEVISAWAEAYQQLATILMAAEESIYQAREAPRGGWRGRRQFRVVQKTPESEVVTSFYLQPVDGGPIMDFQPGQYITVLLEVDGQPLRRSYSLSCEPGTGHYRISVKREPGGVASNYLHDCVDVGTELELLPPSGEFTLNHHSRPLVLLTAGVGITPAISMLEATAISDREIHFIHCALNSRVHAFRAHVDEMAEQHENVRPHYIYSEPLPGDMAHGEGLITSDTLSRLLPEDHDVDLYFLGPKPFMQSVWHISKSLRIPANQIHYEFFGPAEALEAG
ncbi:MAG: NO-inducible flavohemoprotein [Marinobacter sp.]